MGDRQGVADSAGDVSSGCKPVIGASGSASKAELAWEHRR